MQIKCEYCGNFLSDTALKCPHCGATNEHLVRNAVGKPKTIDELKDYCENNGLTPERTRFFINTNYTNPKAFGIYKDSNGDFIVYKNKANGERAIRYQGKDEEYAVGQLYDRLQDEIVNQKSAYIEKQKNKAVSEVRSEYIHKKKRGSGGIFKTLFFVIAFLSLVAVVTYSTGNRYKQGYYNFNNTYYYCLDDNWFVWNDTNDNWYYQKDFVVDDNVDQYYTSDYYTSGFDCARFEGTDYYSDWSEQVNSYNDTWSNTSDNSWNTTDWDGGFTDWDTDW